MTPMEFTVDQLRIAAEWKPEVTAGFKKYDSKVSDKIKEDILNFLMDSGGSTNSQVATGLKRGSLTTRDYLQELARENKVIMVMQKHNKPAIYKVKN